MPAWKIASFNANSIRARLPIIIDWLHRKKPDVLCVQETKVQDQDFPEQEFLQAGYQVAFRGMKSYNGVAIISRSKPQNVLHGLGTKKDPDQSRLIAAMQHGLNVVTLVVIATGPGGPHTFIIESGIYGINRISERNDEPGEF